MAMTILLTGGESLAGRAIPKSFFAVRWMRDMRLGMEVVWWERGEGS
jgi:hypothetical protein